MENTDIIKNDDFVKLDKDKRNEILFVTVHLICLGNMFMLISYLWICLLVIIPGFSFILQYVVNNVIKDNFWVSNEAYENRKYSDRRAVYRSSISKNSLDRGYLRGCSSVSQRTGRFGY